MSEFKEYKLHFDKEFIENFANSIINEYDAWTFIRFIEEIREDSFHPSCLLMQKAKDDLEKFEKVLLKIEKDECKPK